MKRKVYIRPEEARAEADALSISIVEAVHSKLIEGIVKYGRLPYGGNPGNELSRWRKGEMQCGDGGWSSLISHSCLKTMESWMKSEKNTFKMIWKNKEKKFMEGEHNWIEFSGKISRKRVIIDPWPSGGRKIYSETPYKSREGKPLLIYPNRNMQPIVTKSQKKN